MFLSSFCLPQPMARKRLPCRNWGGHKTRIFHGPPGQRLFKESRDTVMGQRAVLSRRSGHGLAILVHQGSYPTRPYQALVTRESARLFLGFAPWGQKTFSARLPFPVRWSSAPLTFWIVPRPLPGVPTRSARYPRASGDHADLHCGSCPVPRPEARPRRDTRPGGLGPGPPASRAGEPAPRCHVPGGR